MIEIKRGTSQDMLTLWNGRFADFAERYCQKIDSGQQEIWMAKDTETGKWIGELHLLLLDDDRDLADGKDTAYLLAFRVDPAYQGRGIGKQIMERVLERAAECGITKLNVGVEETDTKVLHMYQKWGFDKKIKDSSFVYKEAGEVQVCPFGVWQKNVEKLHKTDARN